MLLTSIPLRRSYQTGRDRLVRDFYEPCLAASVAYDRAVGYFTSAGLALAARGVHRLLANGGRMRLVASPALSEADCQAIRDGYAARAIPALRQSWGATMPDLARQRLAALAWLIAERRLEVKLALRVEAGRAKRGIYHAKIGVFTDAEGAQVAFSGSANETEGGLVENFETVQVFRSWDESAPYAADVAEQFRLLWEGRTEGVEVHDFTAVAEEVLAVYRSMRPPAEDADEGTCRDAPRFSPPVDLVLRPHQERAREAWFAADGRGVFAMATGSGKTLCALATAASLVERLPRANAHLAAIVIICPYRNLVEQWDAECRRFGARPILAYESSSTWLPQLREALMLPSIPGDPLVVITTTSTLAGKHLRPLLERLPPCSLVIADECHHLGTEDLVAALPDHFAYRLGLSATPERWLDEDGSERLFSYFGPPLTEACYTLDDALRDGVLCPYRYYPYTVELTVNEAEEYTELSRRIARSIDQGHRLTDQPLACLLRRRARLVACAANKLLALEEILRQLGPHLSHTLVYCGEGTGEGAEAPAIVEVERCMREVLGLRIATYTAATTVAQREGIRRLLENGAIQAVVAMRCLDEGVDIPAVRTAIILASSNNPRQFIQRRGRVLRRHPGKQEAAIYDTIVLPPANAMVDASARSLVRNELRRLDTFAKSALNAGAIHGAFVDLRIRYGVYDA